MSDLVAVAYVSSASHLLNEDELERLLLGARETNGAEQVTGVLLYNDGSFFQYIEGPPDGIDRVYKRIKNSSQHFGLMQLLQSSTTERNFKDWSMGFMRAPKSLVLRLAQASWDAMVSAREAKPNAGSGVTLLLAFWSKATKR